MCRMSASAHVVSRLCLAPVEAAFELLTTAAGMARWNLGMWNTREVEPALFTGQSLFDGGSGWVRVRADAELGLIDYWVGAEATTLAPRIQARVLTGEVLGHAAGSCVLTLLAWRAPDMSDERWQRLMATHEVEIDLIRAQLEGVAAPAASGAIA